MLYISRSFNTLIITTMVTRTLIIVSSTNWLFIWCGIEINLLSFIPLIISSNKFQEQEAATKYFLIQALGSRLILITSSSLWINRSIPEPSYILISALLLKLGIAPCHFWFPSVISSISWLNCLILSTWQKLGPLIIMSFALQSSCLSKIFIIISSINSIIGGLIGLNQRKIKSIIAFSSITHIGWITSILITYNPLSTILYFTIYSILLIPMFLFILLISVNTQPQLQKASNSYKHINIIIPIMILSIRGIPPLRGFFPKLLTIYTLIPDYITILIIILIGAIINIFFYLNLSFSIINSPSNYNTNKLNNSNKITATLLISILLLIPILSITI